MPPCGTPDTSFIDFEIDVPIFTLWLQPVRKDTNQVFWSKPYIFSFSQNKDGHKVRLD